MIRELICDCGNTDTDEIHHIETRLPECSGECGRLMNSKYPILYETIAYLCYDNGVPLPRKLPTIVNGATFDLARIEQALSGITQDERETLAAGEEGAAVEIAHRSPELLETHVFLGLTFETL